MTPERKAALRAACEAATPGPWSTERPAGEVWGFKRGVVVAGTPGRQVIYADPPGGSYPYADQRFIALARAALPEALDELDRLEGADADAEKWSTAFGLALHRVAELEQERDLYKAGALLTQTEADLRARIAELERGTPARRVIPGPGQTQDPATCQHEWEPHLWESANEYCPYCASKRPRAERRLQAEDEPPSPRFTGTALVGRWEERGWTRHEDDEFGVYYTPPGSPEKP